jgi:glycosyltransferase involved in cell wall biosynthesis
LIKALRVKDSVLMPGPLYGRDKLEAYVDADLYVLPSRYETFPMSVLEAVACGKPVILTEKCGVAEYFRNKVCLVVKPDSAHLEKALLELLLNQERRAIFEKNCKTVIEKFTISQIVSKLEEVYEGSSTMRTGFPMIETGYSKTTISPKVVLMTLNCRQKS